MTWSWDFLQSRGFWVALSATAVAVMTLVGFGAEQIALVTGALAAWSAFFVVGAVRRVRDGTRSYADMKRLLTNQRERIKALENPTGTMGQGDVKWSFTRDGTADDGGPV